MKYLSLCRDHGNPKAVCRGRDCRCKGDYRPAPNYPVWHKPGPDEVQLYCRCGLMHVCKRQPVDYWTRCWQCKKFFRVKGSSLWQTWKWHLFGKHEGFNDWDMWRLWL